MDCGVGQTGSRGNLCRQYSASVGPYPKSTWLSISNDNQINSFKRKSRGGAPLLGNPTNVAPREGISPELWPVYSGAWGISRQKEIAGDRGRSVNRTSVMAIVLGDFTASINGHALSLICFQALIEL